MAEHRARHHASQTMPSRHRISSPASTSARTESAHPRRPHRATGSTLATPAVSMGSLPSFTLPTIGIPGPHQRARRVTPARSRRMVITAVLAGALGVPPRPTAPTATGFRRRRLHRRNAAIERHAAGHQPAAAAAAAAIVLPGSSQGDIETSAITGADLAAGALPWAVPAPVPALDPATPYRHRRTAPATQERPTGQPPTRQLPTGAADRAAADGRRQGSREATADKEAADEAARSWPMRRRSTAAAAGASPAAADGRGSSVGCQGAHLRQSCPRQALPLRRRGPERVRLLRAGDVGVQEGWSALPLPPRRSRGGHRGRARPATARRPAVLLHPVSHVGIYLGDGKMVHASTSGQPVKISRIGGRPVHNARRI